MWTTLGFIAMGLCALFLILLILIQRGKGGGLAGAFGGMGGHSAFGTRAGDTLMKITVGVSVFWFVLAILTVISARNQNPDTLYTAPNLPVSSDASAPVGKPDNDLTEDADSAGETNVMEETGSSSEASDTSSEKSAASETGKSSDTSVDSPSETTPDK
jgi:preprotein translocase subunit SecG